jgi:hypothetical protein
MLSESMAEHRGAGPAARVQWGTGAACDTGARYGNGNNCGSTSKETGNGAVNRCQHCAGGNSEGVSACARRVLDAELPRQLTAQE